MQRNIVFAEGEYYHLYNRGTEKRRIFMDERDRRRFIKLLYAANGSRPVRFREIQSKHLAEIDRGSALVAIGAYTLMPNHFHILAREIVEGGISAFMEKLLTSYSSYVNKKYTRKGRLFEGTFQARHADEDNYLKYLFAYIHLNPVKLIEPAWRERGIRSRAAIEKFLAKYQYSSYLDYASGEREQSMILTRSEFPEYFSAKKEFNEYHSDWLTFRGSYE